VHIKKVGEGFSITRIELDCEADVPGIEEAAFQEVAQKAKETCPVSRARRHRDRAPGSPRERLTNTAPGLLYPCAPIPPDSAAV